MQIIISARGLELTQPIKSYVTKKIGEVEKFFKGIVRADVALGLETRHHQKGDIFFAECKLEIPGNDIFLKKEAADLYGAIDALQSVLSLELKKHKEKRNSNKKKKQGLARKNKEYSPE